MITHFRDIITLFYERRQTIIESSSLINRKTAPSPHGGGTANSQ